MKQEKEEDEGVGCHVKEAVSKYLKATSKLTSIEEATVEGYSSSSSGSSSSPGRNPRAVEGAAALVRKDLKSR